MEYSTCTYFDEYVYKNDRMEYSSFAYVDENVYKTSIFNITVLHSSMTVYIKQQYGI